MADRASHLLGHTSFDTVTLCLLEEVMLPKHLPSSGNSSPYCCKSSISSQACNQGRQEMSRSRLSRAGTSFKTVNIDRISRMHLNLAVPYALFGPDKLVVPWPCLRLVHCHACLHAGSPDPQHFLAHAVRIRVGSCIQSAASGGRPPWPDCGGRHCFNACSELRLAFEKVSGGSRPSLPEPGSIGEANPPGTIPRPIRPLHPLNKCFAQIERLADG